MSKVGFWRWLGQEMRTIPQAFVRLGKALTDPFFETMGIPIVTMLLSFWAISINPFLLLVIVPSGLLVTLHGVYREKEDC